MSLGETSSRRRWLRTAVLAIAGGLLVTTFIIDTMQIVANGDIGIDAEFYRSVGRRFLDEGTYYLPHQLSGPYDVQLQSDVIYPPSALFLFVPFAVAPWWLWWVVPIAITGYVIWRWRPAWWGVAAMLTLLCWPRAHAAFPYGNTDMWAMAGVAAALMWGWPSILPDPEADLCSPGSDRYHAAPMVAGLGCAPHPVSADGRALA